MVESLRQLVESAWFQNSITAVILFAAVVVGVQTYPSAVEKWGTELHHLDQAILGIFVLEIVAKVGAEGTRPWRYFYDPWNVFDFVIVAVCFLPIGAEYVTVLRLARLLRVLKLVRALPRLQVLVTALLKSIPSMFYISMLLGLLFYLYAVLGTFLFRANDPIHFSDLATSHLTMYRVSTLEDWTDVMYINMYGCDRYGYSGDPELCLSPEAHGWFAAAFFSSFTLLATMVILNLFIGVIMTGMEEAQREVTKLNATEAPERVEAALRGVAADLERLHRTVDGLVRQLPEERS